MQDRDRYYVNGDKLDPAEVIGPPRMAIQRAEGILQQIERTGPDIPPGDLIKLLEAVADLRYTDWDKVEMLWTPERRRRVDEASHVLYDRLQVQIGLHSATFLERLEAGIRDVVARIQKGLSHHQEIRANHAEPWDWSPEFLGDVVFPLDTLGYVLELTRGTQIEPRKGAMALVRDLDATLRVSLPEIAEEFRRGGDSIDPISPELFPESFWWRRLPGAQPIE